MKELHKITIKGQFEDIDFYYYAQLQANKNLINGYIQNGIPNQLYLEVEGLSNHLEAFETNLLNGFLAKHIKSVNIEKEAASAAYTHFEHRQIRKKPEKVSLIKKSFKFVSSLFSS